MHSPWSTRWPSPIVFIMHQMTSNAIKTRYAAASFVRATLATGCLTLLAAWLTRLTWHATADAVGPASVVAATCLAAGALAAAALALGAALTALACLAGAVGGSWAALDRAASRLTPRVLRRALVVGLGASMIATPAVADEPPDLGWQVTVQEVPAHGAVADVVPAAQVPRASTGSPPPAVPSGEVTSPPTAPSGEVTSPPAAPSGAVTSPPGDETSGQVVVAAGDSLWSIAADHLPDGASAAQIAAAWPTWYAENSSVIGSDPDLIRPGQLLDPPQEVTP